jgi:hypothetical protein
MFCGYCGKENSEEYSFCTGCGKPLDRGTTDKTFQSEDKEKKYESSPQYTQDVEYNETNPIDQSIELKSKLDVPTISHQEEQNFETHEESLPKSKYKSVKFWKHCDWPWQARSLDGENILGSYGTELEAAEAVAKFHGITVDVLLEGDFNLTEDEKASINSTIDELWNAPPKKTLPTEDSEGDDKNDDLTVIASFGKCMEEDDSFVVFKDVKKLPYPREVILKSLCRQISIIKNDKLCEQMKVGLLFLASYQEGVGDENLYMSGFDIQQLIGKTAKEYTPEQLRELPAEETSKIAKKFTENFTENSEAIEHQKKKYEHFKKLCEKDQVEFYNLIGHSWPPTLP